MMRSRVSRWCACPLLLLAGCAAHTSATGPEPASVGGAVAAMADGAADGAAANVSGAGSAGGGQVSSSAAGPAVAGAGAGVEATAPATVAQLDPREVHLKNLRQLTFGGENAEAYFSFDGKHLSFQSTRDGAACDRIFTMAVDGSGVRPVSSGEGATTCAYYTGDDASIIYASTHLGGTACPPRPDMSHGYTWGLFSSYDIFKQNLADGRLVRLTDTPGYDAEGTIGPDGKTLIFTSVRDGDIDLYTMDLDGRNIRRITSTPGYDGGAFFSHDGRKIVWRASRPEGADLEDFKHLLAKGLVRPTRLDIYVADADGRNVRRLTDNKAANFAPYFLPDDSGVIFASNMDDPRGRNFELYTIKLDGTGLTRITYNDTFDGFPIFSPDGKQLAFSSNRNGRTHGETNVFLADWVP